MQIFIYSDESGVLDKLHNEYFVFGGVVMLSKEERDSLSRKYIHAESCLREKYRLKNSDEVKASSISNADKGHLFRSLNAAEKFGIVVHQKELHDQLFTSKKRKQRYLDWAYKISVKRKLKDLIARGMIVPSEVLEMYFYVDEHTTATDGLYELRESLEREFRYGIYTPETNTFHEPLFKGISKLTVDFCDSRSTTLVRAADIVANRLYHAAISDNYSLPENFYVSHHP